MIKINYDKLWKHLAFYQITKSEFQRLVGISDPTMTKLNKNKQVSMDTILKICKELHCDVSDIMEVSEVV